MTRAVVRKSVNAAKAVSRSCSVSLQNVQLQASPENRCLYFIYQASSEGLFGLTSKAIDVAAGVSACISSNRFGTNSHVCGQARHIATRSIYIGNHAELDRVGAGNKKKRGLSRSPLL